MNRKDPGSEIRKYLEAFFAIVAIFAVVFSVARLSRSEKHTVRKPAVQLVDGWYRKDGAQEIPVEPGDTLTFGADGSVTVFVRGLSHGTVTTRAGLYRVVICLDGQEIYRFDDSGFPANDQMRTKVHCDATVVSPDSDSVLSITYYQNHDAVMVMPPVYMGLSGNILLSHIRQDSFTLILVAVMVLCAIASLVVAMCLSGDRMLDKRVLDLAAFLLLCSVWCYCDSALGRYISNMSPILEGVSFCAFMLLGIPAVLFVQNTVSERSKRTIRILLYGFYANLVVQTVLWALDVADFIEMLPATHALLAAGFVLCLVVLKRECTATSNRQMRMVLLAFTAVGAAGILAVVLYWLLEFSYYETVFEVGILLFILLLMCHLSMGLVESLRFKAESKIYARLSREDAMTGLQNRRGFDEFMQELEQTRGAKTNAALFFLDINGLKEVNDRYGHKAGDEMIIGAARCLKNAFGDDAAIFRLGGDEFCVISRDVEGTKNWQECLRRELELYNQYHPIHIYLASGRCELLDENGQARRISDWKHLADQQMYKNKKEMKQHVL